MVAGVTGIHAVLTQILLKIRLDQNLFALRLSAEAVTKPARG